MIATTSSTSRGRRMVGEPGVGSIRARTPRAAGTTRGGTARRGSPPSVGWERALPARVRGHEHEATDALGHGATEIECEPALPHEIPSTLGRSRPSCCRGTRRARRRSPRRRGLRAGRRSRRPRSVPGEPRRSRPRGRRAAVASRANRRAGRAAGRAGRRGPTAVRDAQAVDVDPSPPTNSRPHERDRQATRAKAPSPRRRTGVTRPGHIPICDAGSLSDAHLASLRGRR